MKKAIIAIVLLGLVSGFVLTGCGDSTTTTPAGGATNAPAPAATSTNK